jgi:hypothetical protein
MDIEDSNQDFLTRNLQKIHERLSTMFTRFLDEQIRAIEDTKVKIKKRKGVIAFMKTFPHFSAAIENMLPPASDGSDQLEVRRMVNDAYQRMNKAMFESLKVIAKESPAVMASQGQGDPEDKEALNYHILLIENMNHYMEEVDARADSVLEYWKAKAHDEYNEHIGLYVGAVIRRPLGKLLVRTAAVSESNKSLTVRRNSSSRQRHSSPNLESAQRLSLNGLHTRALCSRNSSTQTTRKNFAKASKPSRSVWTSILATRTTQPSVATWSSRCSRSARRNTTTCTTARYESTKMYIAGMWRLIGAPTRSPLPSGDRTFGGAGARICC